MRRGEGSGDQSADREGAQKGHGLVRQLHPGNVRGRTPLASSLTLTLFHARGLSSLRSGLGY